VIRNHICVIASTATAATTVIIVPPVAPVSPSTSSVLISAAPLALPVAPSALTTATTTVTIPTPHIQLLLIFLISLSAAEVIPPLITLSIGIVSAAVLLIRRHFHMLLLLLLLMVTLTTATTPVATTLALVWQFEGLSSFYAHSIHEVFLAAVFLEVILVGFLVDFARHLASFKLFSVVELDDDTTMFALMLLFEFLFVSLCTSSVVVVKFFFYSGPTTFVEFQGRWQVQALQR
jgi:hypothetical protein